MLRFTYSAGYTASPKVLETTLAFPNMRFTTATTLACASILIEGTAGAAVPTSVAAKAATTATLSTSTYTSSTALTQVSSAASSAVSSSASSKVSSLTTVTPTAAAPTDAAQLNSGLQAIYTASATDISQQFASQVAAGLIGPTGTSLGGIVKSLFGSSPLLPTGENSIANVNLRAPAKEIFPSRAAGDAPYSLSEAQLRAAIYIPSAFTYGQKPPVILVPGTSSYGGSAFRSNVRKLLTDTTYADPVWLNIPGAGLGDIQVNSEYVAYAINYISGVSGSANVSLVSWSQGGIDVQWALTYWPSTRATVSDFVPISPDFHGTVNANVLCLYAGDGLPTGASCAPAVDQQAYNSELITALRAAGGAASYVPTTVLYSGLYDEIVQPQQGTGASAYLQQGTASGAGLVTNNEFQTVCPAGSPGAGWYGHASSLYHPLTAALLADALTHDGPGLTSRLDLMTVCSTASAPALTIADNLETVALLPAGGIMGLLYLPKAFTEPALMSYVK